VQGEDIKVWGKIGPVIRDVWGRLARFFSRGDGAASTTENPGIGTFPILAESSPSGILAQLLSFKSESEPELQEEQPDISRLKVANCHESPFEKCGRLYVVGDDLVIRSELYLRGVCIPLVDLVDVLDSETVLILLISNDTRVGAANQSDSGKAVNVWIDPILSMSPLARAMDILDGRPKKAAVFVGRGCGGGVNIMCSISPLRGSWGVSFDTLVALS